jgi:protein-S-isoprenylcysteine O-methyltransferase Ste14
MDPRQILCWVWDGWIVSWVIAALWSARSVAGPIVLSEIWRDLLAFGGGAIILLFAAPQSAPGIKGLALAPLWRTPSTGAWAVVAITTLALAFCWWARLHLGRLWSGYAAVKAGHHVVDTGPYRLVRHPIYTGLLVGWMAMGLLKGTALALIGMLLMIVGFWLKARFEERFLRQQLGAEAYDAYSRRTPMLIPFTPRGRA